MANWAPPQKFKPLAMTSILRSSWRWGRSMLRSATRVWVVTLAPASLQIVAFARSKGTPLPRLWLRSPVVAEGVKSATAPALAGGQGEEAANGGGAGSKTSEGGMLCCDCRVCW